MGNLLVGALSHTLRCNLLPSFLREFVSKISGWMSWHIKDSNFKRAEVKIMRKAFNGQSGFTVMSGPFCGLEYPTCLAFGSSILPKWLGVYECELHDVIDNFTAENRYQAVIDVGCAEGYYAVGLARLINNIKIYAHDISPLARDLCSELASKNGVSDRVIVGGEIGPKELLSYSSSLSAAGLKGLVICDCEGFEDALLTKNVIENGIGLDYLIELHDCIIPTLGARIKERVSGNYKLKSIYSIDDLLKISHPKVTQALTKISVDLSAEELLVAVSERRATGMEWIYLQRLEIDAKTGRE